MAEIMQVEMRQSCFYCEAERMEKKRQNFEVGLAVTTYQGTAVCAIHAHQRYLEEKVRDKRVETILSAVE